VDHGLDGEPIAVAPYRDPGCYPVVGERRTVAITGERVHRPASSRREIELVIGGRCEGGDERLAAGVLPEPLAAARRLRWQDMEARQIAVDDESQRQE